MYRVDTWVGGLLIETHYSEKEDSAKDLYDSWIELRAKYDGIEVTMTECEPIYKNSAGI